MKDKWRVSLIGLVISISIFLILISGVSNGDAVTGSGTWIQLNDRNKTIMNMATVTSFDLKILRTANKKSLTVPLVDNTLWA